MTVWSALVCLELHLSHNLLQLKKTKRELKFLTYLLCEVCLPFFQKIKYIYIIYIYWWRWVALEKIVV